MRADRRGDDQDFVFTSQKGGQLSVSQAWRIVNALAGEANVTKKVSPHTWRHYAESRTMPSRIVVTASINRFV
jgi:site-specific recombinase XerD